MKPQYIDIHTHLNFAAFDEDRERVIERTLADGVWAINVGTQADTSAQAIALAEKYEGLFAAIGLHPIHTAKSFHDKSELGEGGDEFTSRGEIFDIEAYRSLAVHPKVVAIGECGLDYFRLEADSKKLQQDAFVRQIELANEVGKPLMLHIRNAYSDAYEIFKTYSRVPGNLHFFAGTVEDAKPFLDMGCTFSFTGVITFARNYDEVINYLPLEAIMTETDAPYVAPEPHRGERNEPRFVTYITEKIAVIKNIQFEKVREQMLLNVQRVFGIPTRG